jgi:hypothetical protein
MVRRALAALGEGSDAARANPDIALQPIVKASGADPALIRAELAAVRPILAPGVKLDPLTLDQWAAFDAKFGILKTAPRLSDVFDVNVAR